MLVDIYELYTSRECIGFLSKEDAFSQKLVTNVDFITGATVDFTNEEIDELHRNGYIYIT
jgi:hypothetical protein